MENKKAVWFMTVCGTVALGLIAAPHIFAGEQPEAAIVSVSRFEYSDSVSLTGTVLKNGGKAYVQVFVPEQDISRVETGQTAEITGDAFPEKTYSGTVEEIADTAIRVQSGSLSQTAVEVTVKIADTDDTLKQGYTAAVKIVTSEPSMMTVVPYEAVNQDNVGEFVYVLREGRAYKRYVVTGRELSEGLELKTVLADNEEVITLDELSENGVTVKISGK
ncbi:MAG: HlyD family efflux transporter periplasmic adaptor subunit [Ruminococcus sp.]|nr:HlyD family efflux transporter periplasmic adaptor subunit [Ruminococcus sp.]MCM1381286.1 HlyD family efflux transporter periplasmic adaptor subunit [Muribaculaceae bacterium]MCM1479634.1 HlyD family efflux transporter periplasmic adaptor subunit [Muribaculaceae bacterium]